MLNLLFVELAGAGNMLIEIIILQVLEKNHLAEHIGVKVHCGFVGKELVENLLFPAGNPADAHTRRDNLREGAEHAALLTEIPAKAFAAFPGKTELTVRVILEDHYIALFKDFRCRFPNFFGIGEACGILEVRNQIHELGILLCNGFLKLFDIDPVFPQTNRNDFRIIKMESLQRSEIARVFNQNPVTRVNHYSREHVQCLLRTVGYDNL